MRKLLTFLIALGAIVFAVVATASANMMLTGVGSAPGGGGGTPFGITNTDFASDTTTQTTYNFSARNFAIGSADPSRLVVVVVGARQAGTVGAASGVLINGSAASLVVSGADSTAPSGATTTLDIYQLAVSTGTTATVAVTYPSAMLRAGSAVYSILGSNGRCSIRRSYCHQSYYSKSIGIDHGTDWWRHNPWRGYLRRRKGHADELYSRSKRSCVHSLVCRWYDTAHSGSTSYTVTTTGGDNDPVGAFAAGAP